MRRLYLCSSLVAALAVVWTLAPSRGAPVGEEKKSDKGTATTAEKLRKELSKPVSLEIDEQPLNLAINQLKEQTKINFILDRVTLAALGMDVEQIAVKMKLKDVKLRSALRTLLSPYNLSYAIIDDTIFISTEDVAIQRQMRQRVSIDLQEVEFAKALKQLARETGTNLVIDGRVKKEAAAAVTLELDDVPLETAVRLMAESVNLKPVRVGNVLYVCSKTIAAELRADPDLNPPAMPMPGEGPAVPGLPGPPPGTKVVPTLPAGPVTTPAPKPADNDKTLPPDPPMSKAKDSGDR
jgi:hypothetical protein